MRDDSGRRAHQRDGKVGPELAARLLGNQYFIAKVQSVLYLPAHLLGFFGEHHEKAEKIRADHLARGKARQHEKKRVDVFYVEHMVDYEYRDRQLVHGLIHLAEHLLGFPAERNVADYAHGSLQFSVALVGIGARGRNLAVRNHLAYQVVQDFRTGVFFPEAHLEAARLPVYAAPLVEQLGTQGKSGSLAFVLRQQRFPVHGRYVLLVKQRGIVLAEQFFGCIAQDFYGVVDK